MGDEMESKILAALQEKKIFIGTMMLCRYLNGRGYVRYGCNAGYPDDDKSGKKRLIPCPIFCKGTKIYPSRLHYWLNKLHEQGKLYKKKQLFYDSKNVKSRTGCHLVDLFNIIVINKRYFEKYMEKNTLIKFLN